MTTFTRNSIRPQAFNKIRDLLRLITALRGIQEPIDSAEGLRKAIEILVQLAGLLGIDPQFLKKLQTILADEQVFQVVLSVTRVIEVEREFAMLRDKLEQVDRRATSMNKQVKNLRELVHGLQNELRRDIKTLEESIAGNGQEASGANRPAGTH